MLENKRSTFFLFFFLQIFDGVKIDEGWLPIQYNIIEDGQFSLCDHDQC